MARKPDAADIEGFLHALPERYKLDHRQKLWAPFIYRFEDVTNIPLIIRRGELLSRQLCDAERIARIDCANASIIAASQDAHQFVRLYWRPRTPMQYRVQGIQAVTRRHWPEAHCPVFTFLLFEAKTLLTKDSTLYSDGSLANRGELQPRRGGDFAFLRQMPFRDIYSYGPFKPANRDVIVFRRHAEVLVPERLDLDDLRWIVCRSGPTRDTLLDLLGADAAQWEPKTRLEFAGEGLFDSHGSLVRDIWLEPGRVVLQLLPALGPFEATIVIRDDSATGDLLVDRTTALDAIKIQHVAPLPRAVRAVHVVLRIDGNVAYSGRLTLRAVVT